MRYLYSVFVMHLYIFPLNVMNTYNVSQIIMKALINKRSRIVLSGHVIYVVKSSYPMAHSSLYVTF